MLLPRVITSVLLIPIVIPVVWVGSIPFFLFIFGVCMLAFWEYSNMAEYGGYPNQLGMGLAATGLIVLTLHLDGAVPWGPLHRSPNPLLILMVWTFAFFVREFVRRDKGHSLLRILTTLGGVILCAFFIGHLILLRDLRLMSGDGFRYIGREMTFFLLFVVWATDVGAWMVGRLVGRIKIAPSISPGKTLEGCLGGTLAAVGVGWLFHSFFFGAAISLRESLIYAGLISIAAQLSDLAESLIKRSFGAKNSSNLLPGHGGILDRFDSFIFSAPFFYYLLLATGRFQ